jgi:mono/diheme cytochrome c family protein
MEGFDVKYNLGKFFVGLASVLVSLVFSSCHSNDLGSAQPDRVPVDLSLTGWASGAGQVISQKCANCHSSVRSPFVPQNTPYDLDGIESLEFYKNSANLGLVKSMRRRVEATEASRQMPPRFATPLYDDEKAALLSFLAGVEKDLVGAVPGPSDPSPRPGPGLTFADVAEIVSTNCSGCHNDVRAFGLKTREDFYALRDSDPSPLSELLAGSMPLRNPGFKDTEQGQRLVSWLKGPQTE